ncbi:Acyl-CoA N-acyltransferases (NAT) superfamily protein [Euphorbia peplus]|nr:Acyl-CoA N-acyltransferases (NAT) superfamily protein [Euphorbia peplus]
MEEPPSTTKAAAYDDEEYSDICIRPFDISDIDDFMIWATDEKVTKFCTWEPYSSKQEGLNYIKNTVIPHPWYKAICLKNRPIGSISVTKTADNIRVELGYVLASKYWGKGIGTRAVKLMANIIFSDFPELERVEALVDVENVGSQRVLEKAGFTREGVLRKYLLLKGRSRDMVMFSLLSIDHV